MASFIHQGRVFQGVFSPDDIRILTASADGTAKLWDATSGKLLTSFDHQDEVNHAYAIRDARAVVMRGKKDKVTGKAETVTEPGIADKGALVMEEEFNRGGKRKRTEPSADPGHNKSKGEIDQALAVLIGNNQARVVVENGPNGKLVEGPTSPRPKGPGIES